VPDPSPRALPRLALYQPDIPQNAGTIIRLCACLGVGVDIIEPCGFDASDRNFRRAGMDYLERAAVARHDGFAAFDAARRAMGRRLVAIETTGTVALHDFAFRPGDILLLGRESAGTPDAVIAATDACVVIPQVAGVRSMNVATAAAIALAEALRQTGGFPVSSNDGNVSTAVDKDGHHLRDAARGPKP
jgi:tRNA (cytidine/uridine-2'-O-)-methyltransferase